MRGAHPPYRVCGVIATNKRSKQDPQRVLSSTPSAVAATRATKYIVFEAGWQNHPSLSGRRGTTFIMNSTVYLVTGGVAELKPFQYSFQYFDRWRARQMLHCSGFKRLESAVYLLRRGILNIQLSD